MAAISAFVATYGDARLTIVFRPVKSSRSALSGALVPLYLHPWRWIAIAAPPMAAISDSAATYDDVPRTAVFWSVKSSRAALFGALVPLYLHPWRWIVIAAQPIATASDSVATYGDALPALLLERAQPSRTALVGARATARSPPTAMTCDCSSTNGDDFGFCRHVWRCAVYGNLGLRVWPRKFERCGQEERATPA